MKKKTDSLTAEELSKISQPSSHRLSKLIKILKTQYPDAKCALHHQGPFQLLIATMLSAQCTDERVNKVTPELFKQAPDALAMSELGAKKIENLIGSINFFRNKAKNIWDASQIIHSHYKGQIPETLEELVNLPGVGRKTANVVLGNAFDVPALVVDTHVIRLANRMGLVKHLYEPEKIEQALCRLVPKKDWIEFTHLIILHGRQICSARKPNCVQCEIQHLCPSKGLEADSWK